MIKHLSLKVASLVFMALATVLIYRPALKGGFVFDDFDEVADNPWIKSGFVDAVRAKPFRAIPAVSYRLDYIISGRVSASNSHLINLVFHIFAAFALGAFLAKGRFMVEYGKRKRMVGGSDERGDFSMVPA